MSPTARKRAGMRSPVRAEIAGNVGAVLRLGACLGAAVDLIEPMGFSGPTAGSGGPRWTISITCTHPACKLRCVNRPPPGQAGPVHDPERPVAYTFAFAQAMSCWSQESAGVPEAWLRPPRAVAPANAAAVRSLNLGLLAALALESLAPDRGPSPPTPKRGRRAPPGTRYDLAVTIAITTWRSVPEWRNQVRPSRCRPTWKIGASASLLIARSPAVLHPARCWRLRICPRQCNLRRDNLAVWPTWQSFGTYPASTAARLAPRPPSLSARQNHCSKVSASFNAPLRRRLPGPRQFGPFDPPRSAPAKPTDRHRPRRRAAPPPRSRLRRQPFERRAATVITSLPSELSTVAMAFPHRSAGELPGPFNRKDVQNLHHVGNRGTRGAMFLPVVVAGTGGVMIAQRVTSGARSPPTGAPGRIIGQVDFAHPADRAARAAPRHSRFRHHHPDPPSWRPR